MEEVISDLRVFYDTYKQIVTVSDKIKKTKALDKRDKDVVGEQRRLMKRILKAKYGREGSI